MQRQSRSHHEPEPAEPEWFLGLPVAVPTGSPLRTPALSPRPSDVESDRQESARRQNRQSDLFKARHGQQTTPLGMRDWRCQERDHGRRDPRGPAANPGCARHQGVPGKRVAIPLAAETPLKATGKNRIGLQAGDQQQDDQPHQKFRHMLIIPFIVRLTKRQKIT